MRPCTVFPPPIPSPTCISLVSTLWPLSRALPPSCPSCPSYSSLSFLLFLSYVHTPTCVVSILLLLLFFPSSFCSLPSSSFSSTYFVSSFSSILSTNPSSFPPHIVLVSPEYTRASPSVLNVVPHALSVLPSRCRPARLHSSLMAYAKCFCMLPVSGGVCQKRERRVNICVGYSQGGRSSGPRTHAQATYASLNQPHRRQL